MKQDVKCETLLWLPTHHIMRMLSVARHAIGSFFRCIFHGCRRLISFRTWCMQWFTSWYLLCSNVWLLAHHIMRITLSAKHCMHTSCTFRCIGTHYIILTWKTWWCSSYDSILRLKHNPDYNHRTHNTSSTAQGGGRSFKSKKPIGEVGCCDAWMTEQIHWWSERWLERRPSHLSIYLSVYLCICWSVCLLFCVSIYLCIYLSIYLSI